MKKILVCEDEAAIRDFVVINLTRAGYDVVEADCGEAALQKYEENNGDFDVAILDVMMPGIDGFQVCKELRNRNGGIGIIMLSAKTQEMDKVTGLMLGADDYVTKPFSPSELLARVDSLYRRVALAQSHSENNFKVVKLFEIDGVSVYRFYDGGNSVYFTNSNGKVQSISKRTYYSPATKTTMTDIETTETICNKDSL